MFEEFEVPIAIGIEVFDLFEVFDRISFEELVSF